MSVSDIVPSKDIERIVGAKRHPTQHLARAVSAEQTVYILHSQACLDSGIDLRECDYSLALDRGIHGLHEWSGREDMPVVVGMWDGWLLPDEEQRVDPVVRGSEVKEAKCNRPYPHPRHRANIVRQEGEFWCPGITDEPTERGSS